MEDGPEQRVLDMMDTHLAKTPMVIPFWELSLCSYSLLASWLDAEDPKEDFEESLEDSELREGIWSQVTVLRRVS